MTARIFKSFDLLAGTYFNDEFSINLYDIEVSISVETTDLHEQSIAIQRIKYFMYECLEDSIFIHENKTNVIEKYLDAGLTVCTLPEDPYDQVIGIMLLVKLNAITEGKVTITDVNISSRMSDGVCSLFSIEENAGPFNDKGWYSENNTKISDFIYKDKNKKIVKLGRQKSDWVDLYLDFNQNSIVKLKPSAEIVFASFDKTEK